MGLVALVMAVLTASVASAQDQLASGASPAQAGLSNVSFAPQRLSARHIVINTATRRLTLYEGDHAIAQYPVGVGRPGFATPSGHFQVITMIENPGWENPYQPVKTRTKIGPGTDNPLGTRWMGFLWDGKGEYGIHGTNAPSSVGKYSSHGCVRMYVKDAEALYGQIEMGTPVDVVNTASR